MVKLVAQALLHSESPDSAILVQGRNFFKEQAASLLQVGQLLDSSFEQAVQAICGRTPAGRVLTSGVGKAGHIARKLAATLSSVGIPAFFVHPGDTAHGDFGCFCAADVVVLLSHSGESSEICRILEYARKISAVSCLITGGAESSAARQSDIVLSYGSVAESGHYGLAPTTSTTLMLVLGDALATTCAAQLGVTPDDFARHHPGGSLGKALIRVEGLMRTGARHCVVSESISTREALVRHEHTEGRPGAVTVVNSAGMLVGIFTDGDLRRYLTQDLTFIDAPISEVMTKNPITVLASQTAAEVLDMLCARKIDQVVVVDSTRRPVGLVDIQDIVLCLS